MIQIYIFYFYFIYLIFLLIYFLFPFTSNGVQNPSKSEEYYENQKQIQFIANVKAIKTKCYNSLKMSKQLKQNKMSK